MNIKKLIIISCLGSLIFLVIVYLIFRFTPSIYLIPVITLTLYVCTAIGNILPINLPLKSTIRDWFVDKSIYRICIIGRSGTGKTTLIENAFTFSNSKNPPPSTKIFDSFRVKMALDLEAINYTNYIDILVSDYQGQSPYQLMKEDNNYFFGNSNNRLINTLIFMVDLIPKITDENNKILNDEELLQWFIDKGDILKRIENRVLENYEYNGDAVVSIFLDRFYSKNLKQIILLISKSDLIDKLMQNGYITIPNCQNGKEYAEYKFSKMINNLKKISEELKRIDTKYYCINTKNTDDLKDVFNQLLKREIRI